jgi:hypothetical protein
MEVITVDFAKERRLRDAVKHLTPIAKKMRIAADRGDWEIVEKLRQEAAPFITELTG